MNYELITMKEAVFYKREGERDVKCGLCNHFCRIKNGQKGICGMRINSNAALYTLNYAQLAAANIDPIEKKPLFHFFPGSYAYSIAALGCNFQCSFCQNWQISQVNEAKVLGRKTNNVSAAEAVAAAVKHRCQSIAYTYTEPTVYFEFAYDCAAFAKKEGLYNSFVTNGYMSKEALRHISPYLDAANVDLKSLREEFYNKICKAKLSPVLENIALMKELGIWVELTTLIIPGENDREDELSDIAAFIVSLDRNIPWHISCFYPNYKFSHKESTPLSVLEKAYLIGKEKGLRYIYIGNIPTDYGENTCCPACGRPVIERQAFFVKKDNIKDGKCGYCGEAIAGIFA